MKGKFIIFVIFMAVVSLAKAVSSSSADSDNCEIETIQDEAFTTFKSAVDDIFDAIVTILPEDSEVVGPTRCTAYTALKKTVGSVNDGVKFILDRRCPETLAEIEVIKTAAISGAVNVTESFFIAIRNGQETHSNDEIEAAIIKAEEKSILESVKAFEPIFTGIKILLAQFCPMIYFETENRFSEMKTAQNESSLAIMSEIDTEFDIIYSICKASSENQTGTMSNCSTIQIFHETASVAVAEVVNNIFTLFINQLGEIIAENC